MIPRATCPSLASAQGKSGSGETRFYWLESYKGGPISSAVLIFLQQYFKISNGDRTEWSTIQGVIGRFEITSAITLELYDTKSVTN